MVSECALTPVTIQYHEVFIADHVGYHQMVSEFALTPVTIQYHEGFIATLDTNKWLVNVLLPFTSKGL